MPRQGNEENDEPLYETIAANLSALIESGTLRHGDRMPSVRRAARQHKVSVTTAVQAYLSLENRGLIDARPRSGFFVKYRARRILQEPLTSRPTGNGIKRESPTLLTQVLDSINAPGVVQFGSGSVDLSLLPVQKLNRMLASVARRSGAGSIQSAMPPGCISLRRVLARRALDWGVTVAPDEIMITNGAMEAVVLSLRAVTKPGDSIAIESPTFFGLIQAIDQLGLKAIEIPTHPRHGMCLDHLERATRERKISACVAVPNFSNPLGSLMPDAAKEELATMLGHRDIPLIEDDLHGDLFFGKSRPHVARSFDTKGLVLLCGSFTKTVAPGFRVGWVLAGRFFEKIKNLKNASSGAVATLPQLTLADYVANGGYDHHLRSLRQALKRQVEQVSRAVTETFPAVTKLTRPAGGSALWVELPAQVDALKLHRRAMRQNISIAPGPMFSPRHGYRNFIRLTCGQPWSPELERALGILSYLVRQGASK